MARDTAILRVTGFVQGVGFRYTTKHVAYKYDISGTVKNLDDGSVEIHAIAEEENLNKFIDAIKKGPIARLSYRTRLYLQRCPCRRTKNI